MCYVALDCILDLSNCTELAERVGESEILRLFSAEERMRIDWGLWMASWTVNMIACTHETKFLGCDGLVLNLIIKSLEEQLPQLLPHDSRMVRIGTLLTNKEELALLKSHYPLKHSFFNPIAKREESVGFLARAVLPIRVDILMDSFKIGFLLDDRAQILCPASILERWKMAIKGWDTKTDGGLMQMAMRFFSLVSNSGVITNSARDLEATFLIYTSLESEYTSSRAFLRNIGSSSGEETDRS